MYLKTINFIENKNITMKKNSPFSVTTNYFSSWAELVKWGAKLFNVILLLTEIISWWLMTLVKPKR